MKEIKYAWFDHELVSLSKKKRQAAYKKARNFNLIAGQRSTLLWENYT